jgi:hypothetical protein
VASERYDGRAGIYGGNWSGPVFVLTHRPPSNPEDTEIHFLTADIRDAVDTVRAAHRPRADLERTTLEESGQQVTLRFGVTRG